MPQIITYDNPARTPPNFKEKEIRRVAAYCRVSTAMERQELSFETQRNAYEHLIQADPTMELVEVYGDLGGSGLSTKQRPQFVRMIQDCLDGKIDLVLTKSVSRFARNVADCAHTVNLLREKGIAVVFEKEGINTCDLRNEMYLSVLATVAQEQSHMLGHNLSWGIEQRNASGNPSRSARYGYRRVKNAQGQTVWKIYEPEATRVRLAFCMAAEGRSYRKILGELNRLEIEESTGRYWTRPVLRAMLTSEIYIGDMLTNQYYTPDYVTKKVIKNKGQRTKYYIESHHEPLVSKETFEKVGEMIAQKVLWSERT